MHLRVHRSDGKTGHYRQEVSSRIAALVKRLDPHTLFRSGPIVIGAHNPFSILNADDVCWIEVESKQAMETTLPTGITTLRRLSGREEYERILANQWPRWKAFKKSEEGDLLEALIELSLRSGESQFLHAQGVVTTVNLVDEFFQVPAITATFSPHGTIYINPKSIVRARVYHSKDRVSYPTGLWCAEADDI